MALLYRVYYGNTLLDWAIALFMVLGSVLVARALYWVIGVFDNHTSELCTEDPVRRFSDRWRVITEVHLAIMRAFEQNDIRFALPIRVLYDERERSVTPAEPTP